MRRFKRVLWSGPVSVTLFGCAGAPSSVDLPTHIDWGPYDPAVVLTGQLVLNGSCLQLTSDDPQGSWLVVWQPGTTLRGSAVVDKNGSTLARVGDRVALDGGSYDATQVQPELGTSLPSACQSNQYWLVATVTVSGGGPSSS
jgi:hypothetical protein